MAETASALCFPTFSASLRFPKESISSPSTSLNLRRLASRFQRSRSTYRGVAVKASGSANFISDDDFGLYPWENSDTAESSIQWVAGERVTLFTSDGLIQIGGNLVPRRVSPTEKKQGKTMISPRLQRFQEGNYMDPNQILCLGALFDIAATNGLDTGRRLCIFGFCRSIEMLCDVVEDTVLEHGGELSCYCHEKAACFVRYAMLSLFHLGNTILIALLAKCLKDGTSKPLQVVVAEKASKGGLHEKLTMTVAVPLLWGVPPASETLRFAVRSGGGIVDKVYWQWDFL